MEAVSPVLIAIITMFMAWNGLTTFQHGKQISVLQTMGTEQAKDSSEIKSMITMLSNRLDLFLKTEIDTLKDIARSVHR